MDSGGQEAFYDVFIFLTIITVASCLVLASSTTLMRADEMELRDAALAYARESLDSVLSSTLADAFYVDEEGGMVAFGNGTTVEEFLLVETYLIKNGKSQEDFAHCNLMVERLARGMITAAYDFALKAGVIEDARLVGVLSLGNPSADPGYSAISGYSVHQVAIRIELVLWWS